MCIIPKEHFKSIFNKEVAYSIQTNTVLCKTIKKERERNEIKYEKVKAECTCKSVGKKIRGKDRVWEKRESDRH